MTSETTTLHTVPESQTKTGVSGFCVIQNPLGVSVQTVTLALHA